MIKVTEQALEKIKMLIQKRGHGLGIRVGVRTTGCSGLAYVLEYVDLPRNNDIKFSDQEVDIYVDDKIYVYVNGLTMDWQRQGLNEGFEFVNPNERDRCGCGESFRI